MISLTVTESETQVIFGIPQYLSVSSDGGSIFYTLDGEDPTENSLQAGSDIYLPTNLSTFTIKIKAISDSDSSDVTSKSYSVSKSSVKNTRKGNEGGVVVMTSSSNSINSLGYDSDGQAAKESSVDFSKLEIKASTVMFEKDEFFEDHETSVDFINFSIGDGDFGDFFKVDTVNNNQNFNPKSKVIIINGRNESEVESQSVLLINRPYDTFDPSSKFYIENEHTFKQIISGNLVRSVYNSNTGIMTSYYYESRESKWIVSNQKIEPKKLVIDNGRPRKFVYRWVKDPVMSRIF